MPPTPDDEARECPRRYCNGTLKDTETGVLNGVQVTYRDCDRDGCGYSEREDSIPHDEPTLGLDL